MLMEVAECDWTLLGMFPMATGHSHLAGVCVRTGAHTFESTVVTLVARMSRANFILDVLVKGQWDNFS